MNGQNKLYVLALIISICVIIGITIIFSALYALYTLYKRKQIKFGFEDKSILSSFNSDYDKINHKREKKKLNRLTKRETYNVYIKGDRRLHGFLDFISGIFIAFFLLIFVVGVSFAATDNNVYINNKTYLTIMTSSMEEKNTMNTYLTEHKLENQITQYSLISLSKPKSIDDVKMYDVIAFKVKESELSDSILNYGNSFSILGKNNENEGNDKYVTFVHRVINIYDGKDDSSESTIAGKTYFTTRGDSNSSSFQQEMAIEFDDIIGIYTGFSSYYLGVFIIYFKSSIGIIALISASLFLFLAILSEEKVDKAYNIRLWELICLEEPIIEKPIKQYKQYAYSKALYAFNNDNNDDNKNEDNDSVDNNDSEFEDKEGKEDFNDSQNEQDVEFENNVDDESSEIEENKEIVEEPLQPENEIEETKEEIENNSIVDLKVDDKEELDDSNNKKNIDPISYSKAKKVNEDNN